MSLTVQGNFIYSTPIQPPKAFLQMKVIPFGIKMLFNSTQPKKVYGLILETPFGILIDERLVQRMYLQPVITQYFASNKSEIWS